MAAMMHANCCMKCCLRGSRQVDKRELRREVQVEFLADVPSEVEAEEELASDWYGAHAPHVYWADEFPHTPETATRPRAWQV